MHNLWTPEIILKINKCHHWFEHVGMKSVCSQYSNKNKIALGTITASAFHDKNDFKALNLLLRSSAYAGWQLKNGFASGWQIEPVICFWQQKVLRFSEMQACPDRVHWKKFSGETHVREEKMTQWHWIYKRKNTKQKKRKSVTAGRSSEKFKWSACGGG